MPANTVILRSNPGIKRDGTLFEGEFYTDGQWMRFQRGLPRKIGGYRSVNRYLSQISRGFNSYSQQDFQYCHSGTAGKIERFYIDSNQVSSSVGERTPAGFTSNSLNMWMFQNAYDSSTTANTLLAHVAPNLGSITNDSGGAIYSGDLTGTAALTAVSLPAGANATGGIVMLHPYLFYYGTAGIIGWSVAGTPTNLTGAGSGIARVWSQKIIKGLPLRAGSGSAPAGIFWAYDAVLRASFTGGATVFQFDVLATDTSIMSPNAVVDYDGVFFWAGVDRFFMFSGVVREIPNQMNFNWFFDNISVSQRSKVFTFKVPRFGEIWFCYPRGTATECTHAVIYNVREQSWYDTALPASGRASGGFNNGFATPILTDSVPSSSGYRVWIHEQGVDEIDGENASPIESYFETADLSQLAKGTNQYVRITIVEPDFIQSGPMHFQVTGRANARAQDVYSSEFVIPETAHTPHEQIVMLKEQRRELRIRFHSNCLGGDYQMGQIIGHIDGGDRTVLG